MFFTPLAINQTVELNAEQIAKHFIADGTSKLPCYANSIFSVIEHSPSTTHSGNWNNPTITRTEPSWTVTRILKSDVDLPLNKPMSLTWEKVSALYIRSNGLSDRPELNQFKFEVIPIDSNTYQITKLNK